jgi:uncharacterized LabA/DUF88 family protein
MTTTQFHGGLSKKSQLLNLTQKQLKIPQIVPNKIYTLGVIFGTSILALSQQALWSSIPIFSLILLNQSTNRRLEIEQQKREHQEVVLLNLQQEANFFSEQIEQLEITLKQTEETDPKYLTRTHLTPIIAKLQQIQRQQKVFELKDIGNLNQEIEQIKQLLEQDFKQSVDNSNPILVKEKNPTLKPVKNRIAMFIDGSNLYHSAKELGYEINYQDFFDWFQDANSVCQAFFYTGIDSSNQQQKQFLYRLESYGYQIISKEVVKRFNGSKKANLDVELALDLVNKANDYDTAILVSGDGDFSEAIKQVKALNKRVEVISFRSTTSQRLINIADAYWNLETT